MTDTWQFPQPAAPDQTAVPVEVTIACPECGTPSAVALSRRDADNFCPTCDYPMFWARPQDRTDGPQGGVDDALRRSPGASGASLLTTVACPACRELNLSTARTCVRCHADMVPPLPPEPVPAPAPEPVVVVQPVVHVPEPAEPFPWWWLAAMIALAAVAWVLSARF